MVLGVVVADSALLALVVGDGSLPPGLWMGALDADMVLLIFELVGLITADTFRVQQITSLGARFEMV